MTHDWRMPALGAAAWLAGLVGYLPAPWPDRLVPLLGAGVVVAAAGAWRAGTEQHRARLRLATGLLLVAAAVLAGVVLRHTAVAASPLEAWAQQRAVAELDATVVSDPRTISGQWGDQVVVRLQVHAASARATTYDVGGSVVVLGDPAWRRVALGERVAVEGRLGPADDPDTVALVTGARPPVLIRGPDVWWRAADAVRASIRASVAHRPDAQRGLVPALVDGDDAALPAEVEQDFRTTGLTHLTAVSGTNLTLVVGFLLTIARLAGVRRRWLHLVGLLGIVGFVLLARTEPSVLRAAVMGVVALFAFGADGRRRGLRALGVAVVVLMLVQPALAVSPGFALSALATAGIVVLGPGLQRALGHWLPAPLAEAVAVPLAAQLACTPVIAGLSGQVSLVAVVANLLVAPLVGPATVLGLVAGLVGLVWPWAASLVGTGAAWCVAWLVVVAERGAGLPGAAIGWGSGVVALAVLVVVCVALGLLLPWLLGHPLVGASAALLLVVVVLGVPGRVPFWPGHWPPDGWVLVACDVGQGDALALAVGSGSAIVVDAGPDPAPVDRCLDRLGVRQVPLVVLTHFHADHVDGLAGVLRGRRVGAIETSPVLDPPEGVSLVRDVADDAGVPVAMAPYGQSMTYGDVRFQVLWPDVAGPVPGAGDGSSANNASVVLLVESHGIRLLLGGDVEPPGQEQIAAMLPGLHVDVLKVPHHGSRYQDRDWLTSLDARVAVVSVGVDNDYGHPDESLLDLLAAQHTDVGRTDQDGSVAVVVGPDGGPELVRAH
ncbi:ComEC/Rec2 family competence protein [Nocardioides panacisoli]|uniref:ComEC/Rec2 family competence protein n=1 Tax=Nocardioides panacisoli TaxID=627624 RepID=A0ABP7IZ30_9ACTN